MHNRVFTALLTSGCAIAALYAPTACAQEATRDYDIAAQPLGAALRHYAAASGREVVADASLVEGRHSAGVRGRLSPEAALTRLLAGTGLTIDIVDGAAVLRASTSDTRRPRTATGGQSPRTDRSADPIEKDATAKEPIIVTGTRIRGSGPVGSPVATIGRDELDRSGRATLADFVQTIPQNFSGGPGEATVGTTARSNANTNLVAPRR
jgi:iron complex outermembrane receptor protein